MNIVTVGPEGTLAHEATKKAFPEGHIFFGPSISEVFFLLSGKIIQRACVPLISTQTGFFEETVSNLLKFDFSFRKKIKQKVSYSLCGWAPLEKAEILFAHPNVYAECENNIHKICPKARLIKTASSANTALQLKAKKDLNQLALLSSFAIDYYDLPLLKEGVEDKSDQSITFYVLAKTPSSPSKHAQTAFLIFSDKMLSTENQIRSLIKEHSAKILTLKHFILKEGKTPFYFLEVGGHIEDESIAELFKKLSKTFLAKHFGSFAI